MAKDDDSDRTNGRGEAPGVAPVPGDDAAAPSPISGVDWQTFKNFLTRALNGDETVPPVMLQRVHEALQNGERNLELRDRQWWQQFFLQQAIAENLRAIDGLIDRYNEMAEWHHEQAEKARAKMQEATDRLGEIGTFLDGADEVFKDKETTGKFDREKAIKLLKARGVPVSGNETEDDLLNKLTIERMKAREERIKWAEQYDHSKADADLHDNREEENLRKAQELVEKRDAIRNGGHEPEEVERRLKEIAEEYKLDVQRKAKRIEDERSGLTRDTADASVNAAKHSQVSQQESQVSDFEALTAGALKVEFQQVAANVVKDDPQIPPPVPKGPTQGGPVTSV